MPAPAVVHDKVVVEEIESAAEFGELNRREAGQRIARIARRDLGVDEKGARDCQPYPDRYRESCALQSAHRGATIQPNQTSVFRNRLRLCRQMREESRHERLRFVLDAFQMRPVAEAFRVQLVDVLRSRRTHGKPSIVGNDLQSTDGFAVAGRRREDCANGFAGQFRRVDLITGELQ